MLYEEFHDQFGNSVGSFGREVKAIEREGIATALAFSFVIRPAGFLALADEIDKGLIEGLALGDLVGSELRHQVEHGDIERVGGIVGKFVILLQGGHDFGIVFDGGKADPRLHMSKLDAGEQVAVVACEHVGSDNAVGDFLDAAVVFARLWLAIGDGIVAPAQDENAVRILFEDGIETVEQVDDGVTPHARVNDSVVGKARGDASDEVAAVAAFDEAVAEEDDFHRGVICCRRA